MSWITKSFSVVSIAAISSLLGPSTFAASAPPIVLVAPKTPTTPANIPIQQQVMQEIHANTQQWQSLPRGLQQALLRFQQKNHNITTFHMVTKFFNAKNQAVGKPISGFISDPKAYSGLLWVAITMYGDALDGDFAWTGTSNDTLDAKLVVQGQVFRPNGTIAFDEQKEETLFPWSNNPLTVETSNLNVGCGGYVVQDGYAEIKSDLAGNSWQVDDSQSYFVPCES